MKIQYISKRFNKKSLIIIETANQIITEYQNAGFDLTLRQLYYQFVSRDIIPNKQAEYNKLGSIINDARLAGLIDWNVIVDRTRNVKSNSHWSSPSEIIESAALQYQINKRSTQNYYIEIWIEKDALSGVISEVCLNNDIPYFSCRGYTSQSEMWAAARRIENEQKEAIIIHLGDHDPSGIDMSRDITDRIRLFVGDDFPFDIRRIALNYDQIKKYNPPPNPAKSTDSRFHSYYKKYGKESWELDALEPSVIVNLIQKEIDSLTDAETYHLETIKENMDKEELKRIAEENK
ncbi:MAG: hypothetical protein M0P71_12850 [Melioribacteraceae bacterium]|jgi:hypothetical protein|nr:hypothetical protein [Melioribacteraceae bacterium]